MPPPTYQLHISLFACLVVRGYGRQTVIVPETNSVIENTTLRLSCIYKDSETTTPQSCYWKANTLTIALLDDTCSVGNVYPNIYNFECVNATFNSLSIVSVNRSFHNTTFSCSYTVDSARITGYSTVRVIVPVSRINLMEPSTDVVTTTENDTVIFICNTSAAYPKPNITWFNDSQTPFDYGDDVEITNTITVFYFSDGYMYTVMSSLTFHPSKYDNGSNIYCNATNSEQKIISSKRKALLYVQYPPSTPTFFTRSNVLINDASVIINKTLTILCKSVGNPMPIYTWITADNREVYGENLYIENIKKADDGTYSCMAYNLYATAGQTRNHNASASIEVTVLFPPETPNIYFVQSGLTKQIVNSTLKIVKGDDVSIFCNSTGKPHPVSVWNGTGSSDTLSLKSTEADVNNTCTSSNVMKETSGETRNGLNSRTVETLLLYPPQNPVIHIQMKSDWRKEALNFTGILEGSDFRLYCYSVSNPAPSYKWIGPVKSSPAGSSPELFVRNIQRKQSGPYICYAQNEMERSFGVNETGRNNRSIFFNILYKAVIRYFGATDLLKNNNMITIHQSEETHIICKIESNPFPNGTIFFNGRLVNGTIRGDIVTYNIINSKCSDAGRYICNGKNEYNYDEDATKELILYVKCLPQSSPDQPPENNVSAALSDSAVFRFHAAPYYDPGITEFRWFKQGNDSRILLRNGTKTYISSTDIHSVLRIIDVSAADYGMYLLQYNNSVGMNNFTFYLHQRGQTVSEDMPQLKDDNNNLPVVVGIVIAVLITVGILLGILIYKKRYTQKTDNGNGDGSYDNVCGMDAKSERNASISREPVYEGLKPKDERGYVEMKEQAYDLLKPKDSPDTKDPIYTNLKL